MRYAFYDGTGQIVGIKVLPEKEIEFYSGDWVIVDDQEISTATHYVNNAGVLIEKPEKPNDFAVFDYTTKTWNTVFSNETKDVFISRIKNQANLIILSAYKSTKQDNMQARYMELLTDGLASSSEGLLLRSAWNWIKQIRDASNAAELLIEEATTVEAAEIIVVNAYSSIGAAPTISS